MTESPRKRTKVCLVPLGSGSVIPGHRPSKRTRLVIQSSIHIISKGLALKQSANLNSKTIILRLSGNSDDPGGHGEVTLNVGTNLDIHTPAPEYLSANQSASTTATNDLSWVEDYVSQETLPALPDNTSSSEKTPYLRPGFDEQEGLPAGWERRKYQLGRTYYVDHIRKTTSWHHPTIQASLDSGRAGLPPQWEVRLTPEGRPYFIDHNNKQTIWVDPRKR
jgi:hypothetical protein